MLFFNSLTSEKYKFHDLNGLYFTTMTVVYWIDIFTRPALKHLIVDSLRYCQKNKATQDKEASVKK
jgi:putative transposase